MGVSGGKNSIKKSTNHGSDLPLFGGRKNYNRTVGIILEYLNTDQDRKSANDFFLRQGVLRPNKQSNFDYVKE